MPALPDVPQVLRIDMAHSWGGDPHLTSRSFWSYSGGAPSVADCTTIATDVANAWNTTLAGCANEAVTLTGVVVTDLTSASASQGEVTVSHPGTRSGVELSLNDCVVMNFQISRRYRGGKPRMYGPWGVQGDLNGPGLWNTTFTNFCNTAWTTFTSDIAVTAGTTTVGDQQNVSYYKGFASVQNPVTLRWRNIPTPRTTALTDTIVSHAASTIVGSQRRRVRA